MINEGYGIYQMLHQTDFCYLGRMWLSKDRKTVVKNPHNAMVYGDCVPLRSHDGQMTMGYVVRDGIRQLGASKHGRKLLGQRKTHHYQHH